MSDSLLAWYERELTLLWEGGRRFSDKHPQQARHLGISDDGIDDPHVARVIESFALLTAHLSRQASEEAVRISAGLLQIMFPLCLQPLPSASMIRVAPSIEQPTVTSLPPGTRFRAYIDDNRYCQFHTTSHLELCPFDIVHSRIEQRPFARDDIQYPDRTDATLSLEMVMLDESLSFADIAAVADIAELTIHFKGIARLQSLMYDVLCRELCQIVLVDDRGVQEKLPLSAFLPVGFSDRDFILTHDNTSFADYQMMAELFSWPELFFGFRLKGIGPLLRRFSSHRLTLLFCLESIPDELARAASHVQFLLGCAPVINLFDQIAEPVVVDHRQLDYPVIPDSHSPNQMEIQTIREVFDITGEQSEVLPPLYGLRHHDREHHRFWLYRPVDDDSEAFGHLEVIVTDMDPGKNQVMVLSPHLVCSNGDQVLDLPGQPRLECLDSIVLKQEAKILMRPTAPAKRVRDQKTWLNLLVHLSDNMVSVLEAKDPARQLRNLMSLYAIRRTPASMAWLESLVSISARPQVAPIRIDGHQCFTQGSEVVIELDPVKLKHTSIMMFTNLLDFLASGFAGFHSFIQVVVQLKGREEEYVRCIRRHGYQINR
ncbi:type VI secretion system baseplate subunit TssF [Endozoicomonas sp.]|uniref:type VI secretion system baseplate subunit TssF n=1 Tax=Endozoicomonas sp. TaxID=1892382 RepID=UPI0028875BD0|nr:type VI secretion system baseplate subunit TssF [Endozoicomonas sp.]